MQIRHPIEPTPALDFAAWIARDPIAASIAIDRELVARFGLRAFTKLAWSTVEGNTPYSSNWHLDAIADHLEAVSRGEIKRCIIAVPPRSSKSVSTAVMWPAFDWVDNPQRRSLFASYAHNLSKRDSARCRRVIQSPWYQARFGDRFRLTGDQNAKWRFENDKTGYRLATSVNGQLTGEGGDFCVIDDPLNSRDANSVLKRENMLSWWSESMSTRLNDPANGAFVVIQQRLHEDDLIGDILRKQGVVEDGGEYTYLCLPALHEPDHPNRWFRDPRKEVGELLWPAHVPLKVVNTLRLALGEFGFAGQMQQRPAPREGGLFKRSWFPLVAIMPPDLEWARGWDMAATEKQLTKSDPDWTATVLIGWSRSMRRWYIAEVRRWRESPAMVERLVKQIAQEDRDLGRDVKIALPQDPGAAGKAMAQSYLQMLSGFDVHLEAQSGDKGHRATPLASQASGGNISLLKADWNEDFLLELCGFPTASHDDQVDAAASAFTRLTGGTTGLLEYYARQMDEATARRAAELLALAQHGGTLPGLVVHEEDTTDFARALLTAGTRKPVLS